jgi:excisionase family DNA binding protein
MTVAEVAALLKLNQQTIRNWIDAGTLPAVRIGRRVRVLRSDLHQLIDRSYRTTAKPSAEGPPAGIWDCLTPAHPEPGSS